jgi:hypothetical protein
MRGNRRRPSRARSLREHIRAEFKRTYPACGDTETPSGAMHAEKKSAPILVPFSLRRSAEMPMAVGLVRSEIAAHTRRNMA